MKTRHSERERERERERETRACTAFFLFVNASRQQHPTVGLQMAVPLLQNFSDLGTHEEAGNVPYSEIRNFISPLRDLLPPGFS
jgi:hypothetical protein